MYGMILYLVQCKSLCLIPVFLPLTGCDRLVIRAKLVTTSRYVVPTGRVKVPAGKDYDIVSAGRTKVIPADRTGLLVKLVSDRDMHEISWEVITLITLAFSDKKRTGRDPKGNIMILPHVSVEEHIAVQRETKARTILLQSLPEIISDFTIPYDLKLDVKVAPSMIQNDPLNEDFDQIGKLDLGGIRPKNKWQMSDALWMIAGAEDDTAGSATGDATGDVADNDSNAAAKFALMGSLPQVPSYKSTLQTLEQQKGWYQSNQLALEERIRILTANLENTTNMLKYTEKLNEQAKLEKLNDKENPIRIRALGIVDIGVTRRHDNNKEILDDFGEEFREGIRRDYSNARTHNKMGLLKERIKTPLRQQRTMGLLTLNDCLTTIVLDRTVPKILTYIQSGSDYAEELARLQQQAYEANATAEKHLSPADLAASRNRVPAGKHDFPAGVSNGPTKTSTPVVKPVHTDGPSLPPGHSLGSSEHSTRYPSPSDLTNTMSSSLEIEDIHHLPDTGIFSSSSYDDDFGGTVTNLAPSIVVDFVPTKRVNTIHPQSQILGDLTSPVQTRGEFEMSAMGELTFFLGLQVKQKPDGIFISQDKYVQDMLKKFDMESVRPATTPFEASKPKSKDEPDDAVNVHLYRSMIGSLMYLTASRPDIQFAVSACSRHQVTPLTSNLNAVKKIFKYLKGQPKLGLWYPRDSPFVLEAYSDSDYAGSHGDRKSTTGGCQFLGRRLISWQCKKQTIVATSSTEAEYVAAASCCGQVLKIHTDENVADLLTKAFDGPRMWPYTDDKVLILDWLSVFSGVERVPTGSFTCSYW
ncbi:uncharacterized mitochondrial protein-like protein [Tanacetum coccineum]